MKYQESIIDGPRVYIDFILNKSDRYKTVFTWREAKRVNHDKWQLVLDETNLQFKLFNIGLQGYLCASGMRYKNTSDDLRRRLFLRPKELLSDECEWDFSLYQSVHVNLKNVKHQEFLFSSTVYTHDSKRRNVFTWIVKDSLVNQGFWRVECEK